MRVALEAHEGQLRKGLAGGPYAVHPLHVAFLVRTYVTGDDEVVQAALLHDVVEDCEAWSIARVRAEFGARVAGIVDELTEDKGRSWRERKEAAIAGVGDLSDGAVAIKACDKLHNLHCLVADLDDAEDPDDVWGAFSGGRAGTLEVARRLVEALQGRVEPPLADALAGVLGRLEGHA